MIRYAAWHLTMRSDLSLGEQGRLSHNQALMMCHCTVMGHTPIKILTLTVHQSYVMHDIELAGLPATEDLTSPPPFGPCTFIFLSSTSILPSTARNNQTQGLYLMVRSVRTWYILRL